MYSQYYDYDLQLLSNLQIIQIIIFNYRAFNRLFHGPFVSSLEAVELIIFVFIFSDQGLSYMFWLFILSFITHRIMIFTNKVNYVFVSIMTAYKNKKQRYKRQTICFILQFTILLPFLIFAIVFTTILNTATVPMFGFAYFIAGYPKP